MRPLIAERLYTQFVRVDSSEFMQSWRILPTRIAAVFSEQSTGKDNNNTEQQYPYGLYTPDAKA
jgi:hypothetical protein